MEKKELKPLIVDFGLQKDFDEAASVALREKIKAIDFKKLSENIPLKTMRHKESLQNTIPLIPFDQSGSMGSLPGHEMDHGKIYKKEIFDKSFDLFSKDKIIVFEEIRQAGHAALTKKLEELRAAVEGIFAEAQGSRSRGEELAESFQQGAGQPVAVRKPFAFRPRAQA